VAAPALAAMESPAAADVAVTVPDVVADDADAEHVLDVHWEIDPVRPVLAGSSWKSLPAPLKSFDCLASIPHLYVPAPLLDGVTFTVKGVLVVVPGRRFRSMNSAELDVKLVAPGALVIVKPASAVILTEPSVCIESSFVIVNEKEACPPVELGGETATAKHLPEQVDVCPAAGAASIAAPIMLAASTKKETRVTMKPAFGMATTSPASTKNGSMPAGPHQQDPAPPEDPLSIPPIHKECMGGPVGVRSLVTRLPYHARSRWRRAQGPNGPAETLTSRLKVSAATRRERDTRCSRERAS